MKRQKTPSFWAMMKNSFFWRFLHENGMKPNPIHAAETHSSSPEGLSEGPEGMSEVELCVCAACIGFRFITFSCKKRQKNKFFIMVQKLVVYLTSFFKLLDLID